MHHLWMLLLQRPAAEKVKTKTHTANDNSAVDSPLMLHAADVGVVSVSLTVLCIVLFMTQLIFVALRLSDHTDWLWSVVLVPTWVLVALLIPFWIRYIHHVRLTTTPLTTHQHSILHAQHHHSATAVLVSAELFGTLAFAILLAVRLDVPALSSMAWSVVAIPLWIVLIVWFVVALLPVRAHACCNYSTAAERIADGLYTSGVCISFVALALLMALILVRLDVDNIQWSWTSVLIGPAVVWLVVQACWLVAHILVKRQTRKKSLMPYGKNWFMIIVDALTLVALTVFVVQLTRYLNEDASERSATEMFWPLFLYGFLLTLLCWFQGYLD